jgi:general stress protein 26
MPSLSLDDLAKKMKGIDIATLATHTTGGEIAGRPMSNNGDVAYDGDSFYFTTTDTRMVSDIQTDPKVSLSFTGKHGFWATVEGEAELIQDKAMFEAHWTRDLDKWFEDGVDTRNLILIKVHANRIKYWDKGEDGELLVN